MYKLHEQHREQHKYVKAQLLKDRQLKIRQKLCGSEFQQL